MGLVLLVSFLAVVSLSINRRGFWEKNGFSAAMSGLSAVRRKGEKGAGKRASWGKELFDSNRVCQTQLTEQRLAYLVYFCFCFFGLDHAALILLNHTTYVIDSKSADTSVGSTAICVNC